MSLHILLLLLATILPTTAIAATPWEKYLDLPTAQNAKRVQSIIYSKGSESYGNYNALDLQILALQVYAGDRDALRLAIRLKRQSDGGLSEDLTAMVGHTIRPHPQLFLEEINFAKIGDAELEDLVLNAGLEYVDRPDAYQYELNMRLEALSRVSKKELQSLRNTSIDALRKWAASNSAVKRDAPDSRPP